MRLNISYNILGKGEPVIFIHGIGSRKYSWNGVVDELKDKYRCITYDLRGHGASKIDENEFFLDDLVDDVEKLPHSLTARAANVMTIHLFSSCPMGERVDRCAVDSYGQVHGELLGCELSVASYGLQVTGYRLQVAG